MKTKPALHRMALVALVLSTLNLQPSTALAQGATFTYQGRLNDGASPANGNYQLQFSLFGTASGGTPLWTETHLNHPVVSGLFTVELGLSSSLAGIFTGEERWLEIAVNGGAPLSPRQRLNSTPYAIRAGQATGFTGAVADGQLSANIARLNANQTFSGTAVFNQATGNFVGSGSGLTNLQLSSLIDSNTRIVAWGGGPGTNVPPGLIDATAIVAGFAHAAAIKQDGAVVAWGSSNFGRTSVPAGLNNVVKLASTEDFTLALRNDGTVVAWGRNDSGQTNVPLGLSGVVDIAAGGPHGLALKSDGTVVAWGSSEGTNVPAGLSGVVAIAAGGIFNGHSLAAKSDGTVVAWGNNNSGQTNVPAGLGGVIAVAAGDTHSVALKSDGTVVAWGSNASGKTNVPAGLANVIKIASADNHTLALRADGTVVAWGDSSSGKLNVPPGLDNVLDVAGGFTFSLALQQVTGPPPLARLDAQNIFIGANTFLGNVSAASFIGDGAGLTGLTASQIPNLDASKITTGTFNTNRIPNLDASKIDTGTFNTNRIPNLDASKIDTGTFDASRIPNLDASKITTGALADARLTANVPLRSGGNTFTGTQIVTGGNVGIGETAPEAALHVTQGSAGAVNAVASSVAVFERSVNGYVSMLTPTNSESGLLFGNPIHNADGGIIFNGNVARGLAFRTGGNSTKMVIEAGGNVGIGTSSPTNKLHVAGGVSATAFVTTSDRNAKENFTEVDARAVLDKVAALPITRWQFRELRDGAHLGPTAQDFRAAFGLGNTDTGIATVDADGVALAAIQGLNQKLTEELRRRDAENAELRQSLKELKAWVATLAQQLNDNAQ